MPASASPYAYQAFISYSHSADGRFAPALQAGLQQFARPWNRLRAIRVFRDQSGLAVTPDLWRAIASAMDSAEYFLLLASPQAARSHWVEQEVQHWLSQPRANRLLIIVTDGTIQWDAASGRPDASQTDVLPPALSSAAEEPLWLDLRWAKAHEDLSLQNPRWRDAIASLSATIRGMPKDQLIGEDVRQHVRATRLRRAAIAALTVLTVALGVAAVVALQQRDLAREQARIARARQLAAQAELLRSQQPERLPLALLMAAEATRAHADSIESQQTLQSVLSLFPAPIATLTHQSPVVFADVSDDRQLVATATAKDSALWRASDQTRLAALEGADRMVVFSRDDQRIAGCCAEVGVWTADGKRLLRVRAEDLQGRPETIVFSPDSRLLAVGAVGSRPSVSVFHLETGERVFDHRIDLSGHATAVAFSPSGDLAVGFRDVVETFSSGTWQPLRTWEPRSGAVQMLAYRSDGRYLASGSNQGITVFDIAHGEQAARLEISDGGPGRLRHVTFSGDGQYLAAVGELDTGAIWSVPEWREVVRVRHREFSTISSLSFAAFADEAVSCGDDGYCIGWSLTTAQKIHHFGHQHRYAVDDDRKRGVERGTFAGASSIFVTAGADGTARLWDLASATEVGRAPCRGDVHVRTFGPPGRAWDRDVAGGGLALVPRGCGPVEPDAIRASDPVPSPSGRHAAAAVRGDIVRLWETETRRVTSVLEHVDQVDWDAVERRLRASMSERAATLALMRMKEGSVSVLAVSASGQRVATIRAADRTLRIWDSKTSQVLYRETVELPPVVEFLSDTRMLRVDDREVLSVIRLPDGSTVWSESLQSIAALALSDDQRYVSAAVQTDRTALVRVWDGASGKRVFDQSLEGEVGGLMFDPTGRLMTAVLGKHSAVPTGLPQGVGLKVWEISSRREAAHLPPSERAVAFAFSRDGSHVAAVGDRGAVTVWDLRSGGGVVRGVAADAGPIGFSESGRWLAIGSRAVRIFETVSLRAVAHVDVAGDARRIEFRSDDRILAIDAFRPGEIRGITQLRHWMPDDIRADACRVMPVAAATSQWRQLFPESPVPGPCTGT